MRRFYRLAPALAVMLTISAVTILLLGPISDHQRFARQGIATLLLIGNVGADKYSGDYFSPNPNPLVHTWSLSVEEQIYIFLPLILILILRSRKSLKKITAFVLGVISAVSFASFLFPAILQPIYSRAGIAVASEFSFYSPIDRIWQFTVGGLAYLLLDRYHIRIRKIPKGIQLLTVIAVVMILFGPLHMNLKVSSILASLFAVVVILFKSLDILPDSLIKKIEWVGDRSYSIYLVHMPLLYLAKYSPLLQIGTDENRIIQSVIAAVASILLGALSFSTIENRFRNRDKVYFIRLKNLTVSLALTLLFPLMLFLIMDRTAVSYRPDPAMPISHQPLPWEWDSECQVMGSVSKIERPCVYGNQESEKSILLIGDSHAASNSRAIIEVAQNNNVKVSVFTQISCPFIINKAELSAAHELPGLNSDCMNHNQEVLDYINIHKPTITILSMRSTSSYIFPNTASSRLLYRKNILDSLSNLRESKTNIILVGGEPEYKAVTTWLGNFLGMKGKYSEIPFEDSRWWSDVSLPNFYFINTLDIFCPQNKCENKLGSIWLFNDDHHLSKEGAEMLVPELNQLVSEMLKRNP
jgi:peptidoglycan/LPS O-acetylase OafA/YrhL